jgi:putative CocE/NonD family hydrolase
MRIEHEVMVPMRDGTRLATDIYRPAGGGPVPAVITRTPYGRQGMSSEHANVLEPLELIARKIAVVRQDCRGCFASEGVFEPFVDERFDGHDTIEWVAEQEWCDGNVGIFGPSYEGVTALQAAVDAPSSLKVCFAYMASPNYEEAWIHTGGTFELGFCLRWVLAQAANAARRQGGAKIAATALETIARFSAEELGFMASTFDVDELIGEARAFAPYWTEWVRQAENPEYWAAVDVVAAAAQGRVRVPILHIGGWYDGFLRGHLLLQQALEQGSAHAASPHRLVVGPWDHSSYLGLPTLSSSGVRNFGSQARSGTLGFGTTVVNWLDGWLHDRPPDRGEAPVRYFEMGTNAWRDAQSWPPASTEQRWFLCSDGHANTRHGNGVLVTMPASTCPPDAYIYDPRSPVPTVGGRHFLYGLMTHVPIGVQDQRTVEEREDVLVYTSAPLLAPVRVLGRVAADVWVRSSAETTDFVAKLVDVDPAGMASNVADGAVRAVLTPGETQRITVELCDTAYVFPSGNQLRLQITSSDFPRFARNPNVDPAGGDIDRRATSAVQHILHDENHQSALLLSITG